MKTKIKSKVKEILIRLCGGINKDVRGKVIYYHDISTTYTDQGTEFELFKSHIDEIETEGFRVVRDFPLKEKEVLICFDDGWKGIWEYRNYLFEKQIYPTIFLIVDNIGKSGYLSIEEIKTLQSMGFKFQGHTYSHKVVTGLNPSELNHEIIDARKDLSKIIGVEVDEFCFPCGDYSDSLIEFIMSNGYKRVYLSSPGSQSDEAIIKRNLVQRSTPKELKAILHGGLCIFSKHLEKMHHK